MAMRARGGRTNPSRPKEREKHEELFGSLSTIVPKKEKRDVVEKLNEERELHLTGVAENLDLDKGKGKETSLEEAMKRNWTKQKGKSKDAGVSHGSFLSAHKLGKKKKVVTRREVNEDRELLVNVGVGVIVIVALVHH